MGTRSAVSKDVEETAWDRNAFVRALALFKAGKPSRFRIAVNGEQYDIRTLRVRENGDNSISWTGDFMTATHEQHFATLTFSENDLSGSVTCNKCTHVIEAAGPRRVKITKRANEQRLPTPPIEASREERELADLAAAIDGVAGEPQTVSDSQRALGSSGGSALVNGFKRLRILLVFNVPTCTVAERNKAANVDNMLTLVFSNNMDMSNWELVFTCQVFSEGVPDRNTFAARVGALSATLRKQYGGDLILGIGQFTFELHWRAGGTNGPLPSAVSFATPDAADELLVMPHELLHNFGCGHDRYNAFSTSGTYFCETSGSSCSFGFQSAQYMTIQSYGTAMGGCGSPGPSPQRIYVLSGYPIPGTSQVLGVPCGASGVTGGAWNRQQFETAWNTIADFYSSSSCPFVSCPNPPPPQGCLCSNSPFATVSATATTTATSASAATTLLTPTLAPSVTLCASSSNTNKRASPAGAIVGTTVAGESFVKLSVSGTWTQVRSCRSTSTFYISTSLLRTCTAVCN